MENNKNKVKVVCQANCRCGIDDIGLHISRRWAGNGAAVTFDKEVFDELLYNPSFKYMLDTGMLYIEDMDIKKEIGLEPEEATEPTNIIPMNTKEMERFWKIMPFAQFKLELKKLSAEQLAILAEYAIKSGTGDIQKADLLSKVSGYNIMNGIKLNQQAQERATYKE